MKLSDFDFKLPDELIALNPAKPRDSSKLLRVNSSDSFEDTTFSQLTNFLNEGDVLVVNDTKVIPSKIIGFKVNAEKELTKISFTFFENKENGQWKALAKPARKINKNDLIFFKNDNDKFYDLFAQIIDKNEGEVTIDFASDNDFTPPSEPSITGSPNFFAIFFASILSPIIDIIFALGPINFIPCLFTISENFAFSDKKP